MLHRLVIGTFISVIGGSGVAALHAQGAPQPAQPTFRSAADVVTIKAAVRDAHGRVVSGLTSEDFEVRDNGQLRSILSLRSDRGSPISLAILVDMSGSMRMGAKIAMARQAYDSILSQVRQGEDEVALFTFDAALHERHGFTRDLAALKDGLGEFEPFGTTSLYDGTAAVARRLADRAGARKAVVVLTTASTPAVP
jgi:Ca-activated chloride channel family protein